MTIFEKEFRGFQKKISKWANDTFPNSKVENKIQHLKREIIELENARDDNNFKEEAADCFLMLLHICEDKKFNLLIEAKKKHEINLKRTWNKPDENGISEHKK